MITRKMTTEEIRNQGLEALVERLGPVGAIEFLHLYAKGSGNYTKERHQWLPNENTEKVVNELIERQKERESSETR